MCFTAVSESTHFRSTCCYSVLSHVQLSVTPWTAAHQASLSFSVSQTLFKLMSIESERPLNHFIFCRPLFLPSVFPSIRVFSSESVLPIRWPKYWSFSNSPSSEYSGFISFRIDWSLEKAEEPQIKLPTSVGS